MEIKMNRSEEMVRCDWLLNSGEPLSAYERTFIWKTLSVIRGIQLDLELRMDRIRYLAGEDS